ncbi:hypothetical protein H6F42_07305 [Pseudanabaena sp. FACHB-1998]|uniref:hypothetical protein n=1 Tax=Pseudanabaena sp. FACHB-1998 TaxID=2692858 RepID=UPI0016803D9E|nr:hypothetical protein [Pseudanabaena sp. FACHB-1998]MBD2176719.1 hypothetical protein [Pseudanabaena sp. FACHB-1998]
MNNKNLVGLTSITICFASGLTLFSSPVSAQYCRRGEQRIIRQAITVEARARGGCGWGDGECKAYHDIKKKPFNAPNGWSIVDYRSRTLSSKRMDWTTASHSFISGGQIYESLSAASSNSNSQSGFNLNAGKYGKYDGRTNQSNANSENYSVMESSRVSGITLEVSAFAEKAFGGGSGSARKETIDVKLQCVN